MCGRYALSLAAGAVRVDVESQLERPVGAWEDEEAYNPARGYNIAPRTTNPIILRGGAGGALDEDEKQTTGQDSNKGDGLSKLKIRNMQWGLVPHWMKRAPDGAGQLKTINARDDTIVEGGSMWKSIRGRKRCIVLAEGFYEWLKKGNDRLPHHVKRKDGKLMCFAGLWDSVTYEGEKEALYTYTIITTNSNKQLNFLHDRMPVILPDAKAMATWLDTSDSNWSSELASLLKPFEGTLECYPVPKEVGKVGTQSPDYLKPVSERRGNIASFFGKPKEKQPSPKKEDPPKKEDTPNKEATREEEATVKKQEDGEEAKTEAEKAESPEVKNHESVVKKSETPARVTPDENKSKPNERTAKKSESPILDLPQEANKDEAEHPNLPLNPDEDEKIKPAPQGTDKDAIVLDDSDDEGNQADEPIVLESDGEGRTTKEKSRDKSSKSSKKNAAAPASAPRKRKHSEGDKSHADGPSTRSNKRTTRSASKASPPSQHTETDHAGNEKLENYFEIQDD